MDEPLSIGALLAWARDWQRQVEEGAGPDFTVSPAVLKQYLSMANAALEEKLQKKNRPKVTPERLGRPPTGMGSEAAELIDNGVAEQAAVRAIARKHGKPVKAVREALRRHRNKRRVK